MGRRQRSTVNDTASIHPSSTHSWYRASHDGFTAVALSPIVSREPEYSTLISLTGLSGRRTRSKLLYHACFKMKLRQLTN